MSLNKNGGQMANIPTVSFKYNVTPPFNVIQCNERNMPHIRDFTQNYHDHPNVENGIFSKIKLFEEFNDLKECQYEHPFVIIGSTPSLPFSIPRDRAIISKLMRK